MKGKRELKNLECSINYEARGRLSTERCQRQRGCIETKNALVFGSFSLVLPFGCGYLSGFWVGTSWVLSLGFKLGYPCILSSVPRGALRFFSFIFYFLFFIYIQYYLSRKKMLVY